uniref:C-type lectin domain-containing protein n=1 Tax=Rhabditophanes sp. KR3021 TaxID=114890 RepID=A0AC35TJB8_9BILA
MHQHFLCLFLLLTISFTNSTDTCPDDNNFYLGLNNKCYKLFSAQESYFEITKACNASKGSIVRLNNDVDIYSFSLIYADIYQKNLSQLIDTGIWCKDELCINGQDTTSAYNGPMKFITEQFPCKVMLSFNKVWNELMCVDNNLTHGVNYLCQKNGNYHAPCKSNPKFVKEMDGNCYRDLEIAQFSWETASRMCAGEGSHLPVISNDVEAFVMGQFIQGALSEAWLDIKCPTTIMDECVLSDGSILKLSKFTESESLFSNQCGVISTISKWTAVSCRSKKRVICQINE